MGLLAEHRYDNAADVALRLHKTVCLYRNRPVLVRTDFTKIRDNNETDVDIRDLITGENSVIHSSDEDLEVRAFPLGYVNDSHGARYIARIPIRKSRQGLSIENTCVFDSSGQMSMIDQRLLMSVQLGKMIMRNYPDVLEAYEVVKSKSNITSWAFAPKLMLAENDIGLVVLHYFTLPLAVYNKGKFMLTERFEKYGAVLKRNGVPFEIMD